MDFVIDDQAPVALEEEFVVWEKLFGFIGAIGEDLIGGERDGGDCFFFAGVLADVVGFQSCFVEEFIAPLAERGDVGGDDEGLDLQASHDSHADDRFPCTAGQDDDAATAFDTTAHIEVVGGVALIVAQGEGEASARDGAQGDRVGRAGSVACKIFDGETELREDAFDFAAVARSDEEGEGVEVRAEKVAKFAVMGELACEELVMGAEAESVFVGFEDEAAVTAGELDNFVLERVGNGEFAVGAEDFNHALCGHAGGGGVPDGERGDAVGMNVFRAFFELGEESEMIARRGIERVIHFKEDGTIALHDEGV